jgi:hypothetical protein
MTCAQSQIAPPIIIAPLTSSSLKMGSPDDVIARLKRKGLWDVMTKGEQNGLIRHQHEST